MTSCIPRSWHLLSVAVVAASFCQACSMDESDKISDNWMQGTIHDAAWVAGPGAVVSSQVSSSPILVRIFEQGMQGDPCGFDATAGRRVELGLAAMQTGKYAPATDAGYSVATWDGTSGELDVYGAMEIINAPKTKGGDFIGKARFGSAGSKDFVEGQFNAVVCEDFP